MKKSSMLLALLAFTASAAQAGTYVILQQNDCPAVTPAQLTQAIQRAGTVTGLDLPKDMAVRAELHCAPEGSGKNARFVYSVRATIEKQFMDGEVARWAPVAQHTGFGTAGTGTAMLRQVGFTVRDVIRQEP